MKNNLFYYATSELTQDAFICYLMSFALEGAKDDPVLCRCAKAVLREMVPEVSEKEVSLTNVERQVNHIDVLLTAVCGEKKYKIAIEDKTYTREHSDQLARYLDYLRTEYPEYIPKGVYYKTGFQSDLSAVTEAKYHIIDRRRILELLEPCVKETHNQIILDYYDYWKDFEQVAQSYQTVPLAQWDWRCLYAFYDALKNSNLPEEKQVDMDYGYVANPTGGFEGLWIFPNQNIDRVCDTPCGLYVQIEAVWKDEEYSFPICLKVCFQEKDVTAEAIRNVRNKIVYDEDWNYCLTDYHFHKPGRLGSGKTMTIGIYDATYTTAEELKVALLSAIDECAKLVNLLNT